MKLTEKDRIILLQALPQQASLADMGTIIEAHKLLSLSEDDKHRIGYSEAGGTISWVGEHLSETDVPLTHAMITVLKSAVSKADSEGSVTGVQYDTFMKIFNA